MHRPFVTDVTWCWYKCTFRWAKGRRVRYHVVVSGQQPVNGPLYQSISIKSLYFVRLILYLRILWDHHWRDVGGNGKVPIYLMWRYWINMKRYSTIGGQECVAGLSLFPCCAILPTSLEMHLGMVHSQTIPLRAYVPTECLFVSQSGKKFRIVSTNWNWTLLAECTSEAGATKCKAQG